MIMSTLPEPHSDAIQNSKSSAEGLPNAAFRVTTAGFARAAALAADVDAVNSHNAMQLHSFHCIHGGVHSV